MEASTSPLSLVLFANIDVEPSTDLARQLSAADLIVSLGGVNLANLAKALPDQKPALAVLGPKDSRQVPPAFKVLHGSGFTFRGWRIAGLSGAPRRGPASGIYASELEAGAILSKLPACDLLLTHAPPVGLRGLDDHLVPGFVSLTEYLEVKPPIYSFFAHATETMTEESGETLLVGVKGMLIPPPLQYF